MGSHWRPVDPNALPALLAQRLAAKPGIQRVAVDGVLGTGAGDPHGVAAALATPLRALGRPTAHVHAETFWRDASLRLEYGHEDPESYLSWLDAAALQREVLVPIGETGSYLPSLRDPATNRATRALPVTAEPGTVLLISGPLLLGLYDRQRLPFDQTIHLALSPAARARRTPAELRWTLPALERYDELADPIRYADVVVRLDDPNHPAIAWD